MSNPYVQKEIGKILEADKSSKGLALASAWAIAHFKGINIKIYDAKDSSSLCDYNIIASAENTIQAKSMIDEIQYNLKQAGQEMISLEGVQDGEWILLDLGDIIVHIFQDTAREVFDLDSLWQGAEQVEIPQEYYFGAAEPAAKPQDPTENYF